MGGKETNSNRFRLDIIKQRNAENLEIFIKKYIEAGTTIITMVGMDIIFWIMMILLFGNMISTTMAEKILALGQIVLLILRI